MTGDALDRAARLASGALAHQPAGLLTDLDGTLAPIMGDPAAVRLADGTAPALAALAQRLAVVAVVTGREALDARRIASVPGVLVVGNHGLEWLAPGADAAVPVDGAPEVAERLSRLLALLPAEPGVVVEHKGLSATVHYRNAADPPAARRRILAALGDPGPGLAMREGRMSVELRPAAVGDKGSAVHEVVVRHALRGVVVIGDDLTDLDMFRAVAELRAEGRVRAAVIGVGGDGEVPPEVAAAADAVVASPAEVAALLARLAGG